MKKYLIIDKKIALKLSKCLVKDHLFWKNVTLKKCTNEVISDFEEI